MHGLCIVERNLDLVWITAVGFRRRVPDSMSLDDLIAFGNVGLIQAAHCYDSERGAFRVFARCYVAGAIVDGIRKTFLPRRAWAAGNVCLVPLESHDACASTDSVVDQIYVARITARLQDLIAKLPRKQRALLKKHYWEDKNLLRAGREVRISKSQASRLHSEALEELRRRLL